jgi:hypothetical protein
VYAAPGVVTVDLEGKSVNVNYDAEGIEILSAELDLDFISLILDVEVTGSPGILDITFDRNFFDATFQGADDVFIVIADGDEPDSEEIATTTQSRTLRIELPAGTDQVEIIGTEFVMPETTVPAPEPPAPEPSAPEEPETPTPEVPETPSGPKTQCGTGTVLKDGVCVLEEKCGKGTMLQDGVCVASPSAQRGDVSISRDLMTGGAFALGIALIVMIILGAIGRASRTKDN